MDSQQQLRDLHQLDDLARALALCGWVVRLEHQALTAASSGHLVVTRRCCDDVRYLLVRTASRQIDVLLQRGLGLTVVGTGADADDLAGQMRRHRAATLTRASDSAAPLDLAS